MIDIDRLRERDRRRRIARFTTQHAGHDIVAQPRQRIDGQSYRRCLTCSTSSSPSYVIDEMAVVRAVAGDPPPGLTPAERRAAVAQLRPALSGARIAQRLGVTDRTVWRDIKALRTTGVIT